MSNLLESGWYPEGAEFDPNAPYNEKPPVCKKVNVKCFVEMQVEVEIEIPEEDSLFDHYQDIVNAVLNTDRSNLEYNSIIDYEESI